MAWGRLRNHNRRWHLKNCTSHGGDGISNLPNGHVFFRSHVVRPSRLTCEEYRPKPYRKIGGVQIRTIGRAVSVDFDWPAVQRIANEIADREVNIQRQIWP